MDDYDKKQKTISFISLFVISITLGISIWLGIEKKRGSYFTIDETTILVYLQIFIYIITIYWIIRYIRILSSQNITFGYHTYVDEAKKIILESSILYIVVMVLNLMLFGEKISYDYGTIMTIIIFVLLFINSIIAFIGVVDTIAWKDEFSPNICIRFFIVLFFLGNLCVIGGVLVFISAAFLDLDLSSKDLAGIIVFVLGVGWKYISGVIKNRKNENNEEQES